MFLSMSLWCFDTGERVVQHWGENCPYPNLRQKFALRWRDVWIDIDSACWSPWWAPWWAPCHSMCSLVGPLVAVYAPWHSMGSLVGPLVSPLVAVRLRSVARNARNVQRKDERGYQEEFGRSSQICE
jgi:hypothetical protein